MKKIAVLMGSDSDLPVVKKAFSVFDEFGVTFEAHIYSAHRTPVQVKEFVGSAREKGFDVIIAAAGKAAHLAGAVAAATTLPVIGIPISSAQLDGMDALLSTVQMPPGIPVATVGIDAAQNAALLAVQMLAVEDKALADKMSDYKKSMEEKVLKKDEALQKQLAE